MQGLETLVITVADIAQILFEGASIITVIAGGVAFLYALVTSGRGLQSRSPRLVLARYLILALELQLAADIIATATHPSLEELGKLAAIALIRTFLNYFLVAEMRDEKNASDRSTTSS